MFKVCCKCKEEHPESNFSKSRDTRDGLNYTCKKCNKMYRETHKERNRTYAQSYQETHREQITEQRKQYRAVHRDLISAEKKQYRSEHREHFQARDKQYHAEHKEERREYMKQHKERSIKYTKQYYAEHTEAMHKAIAIWRKNNPGEKNVHNQTRRAKKSGLVSTLTQDQWEHILNEFNNTCAYCGVGDKKLHQEHFVPVATEGEYTQNNIIPACKSCNSSKGKKSFWEWYPTSSCYDKQREKKVMRFLHYTGKTQQLTLCL